MLFWSRFGGKAAKPRPKTIRGWVLHPTHARLRRLDNAQKTLTYELWPAAPEKSFSYPLFCQQSWQKSGYEKLGYRVVTLTLTPMGRRPPQITFLLLKVASFVGNFEQQKSWVIGWQP